MSTRTGPIRTPRVDVASRPFIVIWEATRACALACRHCRADAIPDRDPRELSTVEAAGLMAQVASFGSPSPLFVITGGDPFERPDLDELVATASDLGLHVSISPSATPRLTEERLAGLRSAGAVALSLSIDAASVGVHDGFRGVAGVFERTIDAWHAAHEVGMKVQINTTVTAGTVRELPRIAALVDAIGAMTWSVFLLVPTGRGAALDGLTPEDIEDVLHFLYDVDTVVSVKATEAHQFRRVVVQRTVLERRGEDHVGALGLGPLYAWLRHELERAVGDLSARPRRLRRTPMDVAAGRGFVFVSHTGEVFPSGFLPLAAGDVRSSSLPTLYRSSALFRRLRQPERLGGRCGRCEFQSVCGGSRARAFAVTGDLFAEEPSCPYEPGSFGRDDDVRPLLGA